MSKATDKLQAIEIWSKPIELVIPQAILDVLTVKKPNRKPRK